jgi:hypothetical protein
VLSAEILTGKDTTQPFQAGHAGSIPVTRSRHGRTVNLIKLADP